MPLDVAHKVFSQLVSALTYLHSKGVAHCDIKPDNILIDRDANVSTVHTSHSLVCADDSFSLHALDSSHRPRQCDSLLEVQRQSYQPG